MACCGNGWNGWKGFEWYFDLEKGRSEESKIRWGRGGRVEAVTWLQCVKLSLVEGNSGLTAVHYPRHGEHMQNTSQGFQMRAEENFRWRNSIEITRKLEFQMGRKEYRNRVFSPQSRGKKKKQEREKRFFAEGEIEECWSNRCNGLKNTRQRGPSEHFSKEQTLWNTKWRWK